ncbi:MAG: glycosyltransferase [Verrucomicrobia bacterium]|nr:glycosyltransferase [Verrucomicrobiota bacterium]
MKDSSLRILYASPNLPEPATSGGSQRTGLLLDTLRGLGHVDAVFLPAQVPDERLRSKINGDHSVLAVKSTDYIQQQSHIDIYSRLLGTNSASFFMAGRHRWQPFHALVRVIGDIQRYDLVVSRYLSSACIINLFRHPHLLIDVDDFDPDRLRQRISSVDWLKRLTLKRCLRYSEEAHRNLLPRAAHCWVSNPADRRHPGLSAATLLPNIPYFPAGLPQLLPPPPANESPVFLIVGTLSYSANSDGIDAFLREAWLALRNQAPNVELHIVGQGLSVGQRKRWGGFPGVKPIGFVESLSESYARCIATLAPILAGGGTNIKVLESSAYGRPCVVSRIAHRGFEDTLPAGEACLRAEQISDMAGQCLRLIGEPGLAQRIGAEARASIERHYTVNKFNAAVREGCEIALKKPL